MSLQFIFDYTLSHEDHTYFFLHVIFFSPLASFEIFSLSLTLSLILMFLVVFVIFLELHKYNLKLFIFFIVSLIFSSWFLPFLLGNSSLTFFRSDQSLSRVRLCDSMNCNTPGLPVHHQLPEFTQTHFHWVSDAIQPSHPLSSPSPLAPNPSQHLSLFQWVYSSREVAKVLEFQL